MNTINLLEKLANNAHHRIEAQQMLEHESDEIYHAFINNNQALIRKQFNDEVTITAHRSTITQLNEI